MADRWRCKCAIRTSAKKNAQAGYFEHPSLQHRTSYRREIFIFARHVILLQGQLAWSLYVISSLRNDALNFEKILKVAKLAKFGKSYLYLGEEIAESRRQKLFNFTREQYAARIIYLAIAHCPTSFGKGGTIRKIRKFQGLPGSRSWG